MEHQVAGVCILQRNSLLPRLCGIVWVVGIVLPVQEWIPENELKTWIISR